MLRDHKPTIIEDFKGLWKRGDPETCPINHFTDVVNFQSIHDGFETRDGLDTFLAKGNVVRMYNYVMPEGQTLLILDTSNDIYHALLDGSNTVYGPILHIDEMTDFGFVGIAGRAYITPFTTYVDDNGFNKSKGLENEFVYVYLGDGSMARKAAGDRPVNGSLAPFIAFNSANDGVVTQGVHIIAVTFDTGSGFGGLGPEIFPVVYAPGDKQINLTNIPVAPGGPAASVTRRIVMTHAIDPKDYIGGTANYSIYPFYNVVDIPENTTVSLSISVADANLTVDGGYYGDPNPPTNGAFQADTTSNEAYCELGFHLFGVVYETNTGHLTAPGPELFAGQTSININKQLRLSNVPVSPNAYVVKRHIIATRAIQNYNGDQLGYQFYFVPNGTIDNNTDTEIFISFYDSDLFDDASHLIDNFNEIPAGVGLSTYHGRMIVSATFNDESVAYLSAPGEPEAINQVDGVIIAPRDGKPITICQEFRDILYIMKQTRTIGYADNGDVPATWPTMIVDQGVGAPVHGIASVLDSGGVNIDYLLIVDYSGLMLFNGAYARPELSWKIEDEWFTMDRNGFDKLQIKNDSLNKQIYISRPDGTILMANYDDGLNPKDIKWWPWTFPVNVTTIELIETSKVLIGAGEAAA